MCKSVCLNVCMYTTYRPEKGIGSPRISDSCYPADVCAGNQTWSSAGAANALNPRAIFPALYLTIKCHLH